MTTPKVFVVILNYKVADLVERLIKILQSSSYKNLQVVVVDNNSNDQLGEIIQKYKDIHFIQNDDNLGYAGGNNVGIKFSLEKGADLVLILNPDITLRTDTISNLVRELVAKNADVAGPKIYFKGSSKIWFAGGILDKKNALGVHRGVDEEDRGQYNKAEEVDFITGAAILIKREVFEKIGYFDENYFLYLEDLDFCLRAKKSGFRVLYAPVALAFHENAKSTGLGSSLQDYYISRNRMLFAFRYLNFRTRFALFRYMLSNLLDPIRRRALLDFLTGSLGQGSVREGVVDS